MEKYIILFLILLFIFLNYNKKEGFSNNNLCYRLYSGNNKRYCVIKKLVNPEFCANFIEHGEEYASKHEWTTKRHDNYPTTDNEVTKSWCEYKTLKALVKGPIGDKIAKMYKINKKHIGINEFFIVKYNINGQRFLKYHEDGSEFSFVIGLNDEYEGGGTKFKSNGKTVKLDVGDCLVFSGQNRHKGNSITSGTRYIVAGFLNYKGENYCKKQLKK